MTDLLSLDEEALSRLCAGCGDGRPYRVRQLVRWLYRQDASRVDEMSDLPAGFRTALGERASIARARVLRHQVAVDGTHKFLFGLADGSSIETVVLRHPRRYTGCLSTQVGCAMGCTFCATAIGGLKRNLSAGEIVEQVLAVRRETGIRLTNLVFMGMGEPLANYEAVLLSTRLLTEPSGLAFGPRQITVSTAGLAPAIRRLAADRPPFNLAVSLHATTDEVRSRLMPVNRAWPISTVLEACEEYVRGTGKLVTFEFLLLGGVNDSLAEARRLAAIARRIRSKVNLIAWNAVSELGFRRPSDETVRAFQKEVESAGVFCRIRETRGTEIAAACGQLQQQAS